MAVYRVVHHADGTLFVYCDHRGEAGFYAGLVRYGKVNIASDLSCDFATSKPVYDVTDLANARVERTDTGLHAAAIISEELTVAAASGKRPGIDDLSS